MGPVSSIVGSIHPPALAGTAFRPSAAAQPAGATPATMQPVSSSSIGSALAISQVHSSVSQLLQSIGGGVEQNKALEMLIALLIILALLEQSQSGMDGAARAMQQLGAGRSSQSQFFSLYSSSTTITIEQTTTMVALDTSQSVSLPLDGGDPPMQGGAIDVAA